MEINILSAEAQVTLSTLVTVAWFSWIAFIA
jgi:hypothetical protein